MEACDNCGRTIGELETPRVFREHIVCAECHRRLGAAEPPARTALAVPRAPELEEVPFYRHGDIVVARSHFTVGNKSYALRNITSVAASETHVPDIRPSVAIMFLVGFGLILLLGFLNTTSGRGRMQEFKTNTTGPRYREAELSSIAWTKVSFFGAAGAVVSLIVLLRMKSRASTIFHATVTAASGEQHRLDFPTPEYRGRFCDQLRGAMAAAAGGGRYIESHPTIRKVPRLS